MRVTVVYAAPGVEAIVTLALAPGATVAAALAASGLIEQLRLDESTLAFAIFSQRATRATPLREGDRVEILRPLQADPKDARRRRAQENPLPRCKPEPKRRKSGNR